MNFDIDEKSVKHFSNLLDYVKRLSEGGINSLLEKQILIMLDDCVPFFSHLTAEDIFPQIHRITINKNVLGANKRIKKIEHLKYPPADKVKRYGRCNLPKQSVLYGALYQMTCINEIKPKIGDLVTHSTWRVNNNESLVYCPIFKNQPPKHRRVINPESRQFNDIYEKKLKEFPPNISLQVDSLVQFIADAFTKDIPTSRHLDYIFSAYFSDKMFNKYGKEAIYYPSVKDGLTFPNIAFRSDVFDKKYQLVEVKEDFVVQERPGHFSHGITDTKSFDYASGTILWDDTKIYQSDDFMRQIKFYHGVDIS